jgi:glycosyltransferase involved in cell wall biosynthesis
VPAAARRDARPLTIALATIEYPPDPFSSGIGSYTKTMAEALARRGHTVHVVTRGTGEDSRTQEGGVTIHRVVPARPPIPKHLTPWATALLAVRGAFSEMRYRRKLASKLAELVENEGVELIEAADHAAEAAFYDPRKHPRVPFVVRLHTPVAIGEIFDRNLPEIARRLVGWYERRFLRRATHLTATSNRVIDFMAEEMRLTRSSITSLPNPPTFDPDSVRVQEELEDSNMVLFVGRVNHWKGTHLLMKAIPLVLERKPTARFVLVGADAFSYRGHASMREYLLGLLPQNCRDSVLFKGRLPHHEVGAQFQRASVCVFPSLFEVFGYTCLEAMTYGRAIVGSSNGGMSELLDDGRAGLLFTPPDYRELADKILSLLGDPDLRRTLGARARERVLAKYDIGIVLERFVEYYRQAIADLRG